MAVFDARKHTKLFVGSRQVDGVIFVEIILGVFYTVKCPDGSITQQYMTNICKSTVEHLLS
jgi:hypothetical protein